MSESKRDLIARAEALCAEFEQDQKRASTGIEFVDMSEFQESLKKTAELADRLVAARAAISLPPLCRPPAGRN